MLSLAEGKVTPDEAAEFRMADDPQVGRVLVIGPWLAGAWSARVQYRKPYPPAETEICGRYRTVDLLPYTAAVRSDFYDSRGKRLNRVEYPLLPAANWTPFSVRFDKFPVGTARMEFSFGLGQHTEGEVWFARLEKRPAGPHPLADMPAPKLTRLAPPGQQKGTGFWRVERCGETWWLIDPEGRPSFSRATAPPNPPATWKEGLAAADKYVGELRDWGFDGLAGWHSLRLYAIYNRELKKQGRPTIPQFAVLTYRGRSYQTPNSVVGSMSHFLERCVFVSSEQASRRRPGYLAAAPKAVSRLNSSRSKVVGRCPKSGTTVTLPTC